MHRILVIRLYFPLDALYVSDYISPSSGAYHTIPYHMSVCCVATQQTDIWYRHIPNAMYSLKLLLKMD